MRLATGRTDPASPGGGPRQPPNHSTSHLGEPRFLYSFQVILFFSVFLIFVLYGRDVYVGIHF